MSSISYRQKIISIPLISGFIIFYIVPFFISVGYSTEKSSFNHAFVGIQNYLEILSNHNFLRGAANTGLQLLLSVPLILILALLLTETSVHIPIAKQFLLPTLLLPTFLPSISIVDIFSLLRLSPRVTLLTIFLWKYTGFITLILAASRFAISNEIYETAYIDGANYLKQFGFITIPMLANTIMLAFLLAISMQLRIFRESYLLYGAYPDNQVYSLLNYINNQFRKLQYPLITSSSNLFFGILCFVLIVGLKCSKWIKRGIEQ